MTSSHPLKRCTLKRNHLSHTWWSRKLQCFFWCDGELNSQVPPFKPRGE